MKTFYLIDGHAQMFRAYYAPFRELTAPDGRPVKAVYVFTQLILSLLAKRPDYLAIAFDVGDDSTFRKAEYDEYKANRDESPEDLAEQYLLVRLILEKLNVAVFEQRGYEADDLIATIAKRLPDDVELRIVSKDKDLHQVLTERVGLYDPKDDATLFGPDLLPAKGYAPEQAVEIQTLVGDPTDNVPGVNGIGVKTAAKLIQQYGSADAVLAAADEQTPKRRENLLAAREIVPITRRLVTLLNDVPMAFDLEACRRPTPDRERVKPIFDDLGFRTFVEQLPGANDGASNGASDGASDGTAGGPAAAGAEEALRSGGSGPQRSMFARDDAPSQGAAGSGTDRAGNGASAGASGEAPAPASHRDHADYRTVLTASDLDDLVADLTGTSAFAVDTETTGLRPMDADLLGVAIATRAEAAWYVPVRSDEREVLDPDRVLAALAPFLGDPQVVKVGQNLKYDLQVLWNAGARVDGPIFDTLIAAALLRPDRRGNGLDALARDLLGLDLVPTSDLIGKGKKQISMLEVPLDRLAPYAAEDADVTWRLFELLRDELDRAPDDLRTLVEELEFPLVRVLARMEARGIHLDAAMLHASAENLSARIETLRGELQEAAGRPFNPDSPAQLSEVLFDDLGMRVVKRTKTGRSTDAGVLETLASESDHPLPGLVLRYRELTKLLGTYVAPLPSYVSEVDGRLHASFHQVGAATGRLSSSDPNLQNIPVRTEDGRRIRTAFVAEKGMKLISAD
ncbi:MAG: DNA polymerase, partial [Trueperaceae bacterium]